MVRGRKMFSLRVCLHLCVREWNEDSGVSATKLVEEMSEGV